MMALERHDYTYRAYGLDISSNRPIPNLVPVAENIGSSSTEHLNRPVSIDFRGTQSWFPIPAGWSNLYQSPSKTQDDRPFLEVWQHATALHLRHSNNAGENGRGESVDFSMSLAGEAIDIAWTAGMPFQDIVAYLLGPVLGTVLRLRGITCLHAAAIAIEQKAIAIIGSKGAGKSTTAAFFVQQGHQLLTDDIAPLLKRDGQFWVQPGYPCLRLWPNTIDGLSGIQTDNLPPVLSFAEKRYLPLALKDIDVACKQFQPTPLPLVAIYLLSKNNDSNNNSATNVTTVLLPANRGNSLVALVRNAYADYALDETGRSRDFRVLGELLNEAPLKQVKLADDLETLPQLYNLILQDCPLHDRY